MAKRPELLIGSGPMSGTRFQVGPGGVRLGRSSSNDVHVPDEELSRNHCLFEQSGESSLRVTDLASANGTFVNGVQLGSDSRELNLGDTVEVGSTKIHVLAEGMPAPTPPAPEPVAPPPVPSAAAVPARRPAPGGAVDLGLGGGSSSGHGVRRAPADASGAKRRSPLANILWIVAALVVAAAIAVVLCAPRESTKPLVPVQTQVEVPKLASLYYEKVEADSARIFRYQMTIDSTGTLSVSFDDVPAENRHVDKKAKLSDAAMKRVMEILDAQSFAELEDEYAGSTAADENALTSYRIRVVRWNSVKDVLVENTQEPDAFRSVREALEAFSRNELGIWAIQYSGDKLIEMSAQSAEVGDAKWEEREVEYGNLSASVKAYKEAIFYLDTINPKPEGYAGLKERLARSEEELKRRYEDQRFLADKAINLGDWEAAQTELKVLCDLVPEKDDPRHAEANAKLVDVENRMKKAKGGR